jgi:hypothetical protein
LDLAAAKAQSMLDGTLGKLAHLGSVVVVMAHERHAAMLLPAVRSRT